MLDPLTHLDNGASSKMVAIDIPVTWSNPKKCFFGVISKLILIHAARNSRVHLCFGSTRSDRLDPNATSQKFIRKVYHYPRNLKS